MATANLAPALHGSRPSGNISAQRFDVAVQDQKIHQLTEEDLKQVLRYIFSLVGIRAQNMPAGEEKTFLHAYIFEHYGNHTPAEIRLAFDMAVQGRLDLAPDEVKCYENFSVLYFATIMRAYRAWAVEEARRLERIEPPTERPVDHDKIDQEYRDYLITAALWSLQELDQLPTTLKRLYQWRRANSRTK
jgi:hypothetical protein